MERGYSAVADTALLTRYFVVTFLIPPCFNKTSAGDNGPPHRTRKVVTQFLGFRNGLPSLLSSIRGPDILILSCRRNCHSVRDRRQELCHLRANKRTSTVNNFTLRIVRLLRHNQTTLHVSRPVTASLLNPVLTIKESHVGVPLKLTLRTRSLSFRVLRLYPSSKLRSVFSRCEALHTKPVILREDSGGCGISYNIWISHLHSRAIVLQRTRGQSQAQ